LLGRRRDSLGTEALKMILRGPAAANNKSKIDISYAQSDVSKVNK